MKKYLQKYYWYPPAETKISFNSIFASAFSSSPHFKKKFSEYLGVENCVLGGNARSLLYLLLKTLFTKDNEKRDEVLIPGYTCYSVAASIVKAGLKIRVYDIDPLTFHPDIDSLRRALNDKTLALLSQHLFGIPTPLNDIIDIAKQSQIYHIEDAAQALGGSSKGRLLGTLGDFGLYSFGRGKPLPLGEGGALISKENILIQDLKFNYQKSGLLDLLLTAFIQLASKSQFYRIPEMLPIGLGETVFNPGFEIEGIPRLIEKLAERSLILLDDLNTHRRHIADTYFDLYDGSCIIPIPKDSTPVYTRFPLLAGSGPITMELKRLGIRRMYPKTVYDEEIIKPYLSKQHDTAPPGAAEVANKLITLPTHKMINKDLASEIISEIVTTFNL